MITGIIVALSEELSTLKSLPNSLWEPSLRKGKFVFLTDEILLVHAGAGAENAHKAAELAILKGATQLISWGCCAALSPDLKMGDLILVESIRHSQNQEIPVHPLWHQHAKNVLGHEIATYKGSLLTSEKVISTAHAKSEIYEETNAIILDMESYAIAQVAQHYALPFLAIRVVADPASLDLPEAVTKALNENGEVSISKIITSLVFNPKELPHLIQLGQYFQIAKKMLSNTAKQLPDIVSFK